MKIRLFLFILLISAHKLYPAEVKFYSINTIHSTSVRETFSVCKDEDGFIWSSAKTGILRVTEDHCRMYQLPYKTVDITFLKLTCEASQLIAYTNNGQIFIYNQLYDRFDFLADMRERLKNNYLTLSNIVIDQYGTLWIGSSDGLYHYKDGRLAPVGGLRHPMQYIFFTDKRTLLYADSNEIALWNIETSDHTIIHKNEPDQVIQVSSCYYDQQARLLWIGTFSQGLYLYNEETDTFSPLTIKGFPKQPILALKDNANHSLLAGIDGQGIWELDRKNKTVLNIYKEDINNVVSLRGDGVYDIFNDKNNRIWVATYTGGLSFFEQNTPLVDHITHEINNPHSLGNNDVHQIIEDRKGNIWFTTNNGISRWRPSDNQWDIFHQNMREQAQVFLAICEDGNGDIWAGTYSSGIYVLDSNTGKVRIHYPGEPKVPNTPGKFIFDIFKDSEDDIWIGGVENVSCYFSNEKRFCSYPLKPVNSFAELTTGQILATHSHGLSVLHKNSGEIETLIDSCLAHDVITIGNDIWIGTSGSGLIRYNYADKSKKQFTTDTGLPSNYINSIIATEGYLWIGTENGLCQLNPYDNSILTYSSIFSLSNSSYNINSCTQLSNGNLVWGTNNGAVLFSPNKLYQTSYKGRIFFQDIIVSGRSIREYPDLIKDIPVDKQTGIKLYHNQNTLSLELLSADTSSKGVKFSWMMEGLDSRWSSPSALPNINYANLPSGNFKLTIRMYDSSLTRIIDERSIDIQIIPPFWATWWFRLFFSLLLISIITYLLRTYSNHLKQKHAKEKIRFFTNMAHDIRTSLTLISAPVEQMDKSPELSEKTRYFLNLARDQSKRLTAVATQLLDFEKVDSNKGQLFPVMTDVVQLISNRCLMFSTTAGKRDIRLEFRSNLDFYLTALDELKIEKTVDNLISNAIKYSHSGGVIEINLSCEKDQWHLEVKDYGLGISSEARKKLFKEFYRGDNKANSKIVGSGIGLLLVKSYVNMHSGKIEFDSEENKGSSFRITIPYKEVTETVENSKVIVSTPLTEMNNDAPKNSSGKDDYSEENQAMKLNESTETNETSKDKVIRILVVEDNTDLQEFLQKSMEADYKVSIANDGIEALALIGKENFDLIISDIMMPGMDGFELCRRIKSTFETAHIPVILLTSLSEKVKQLEGLGLGADDYITKPFDITLLLQRIKSILRNREIVRERAFKLMNQNSQDKPVYKNEINDRFVKKALEVVHKNMSNTEFGKDEFASEMNVSPSLLYQKLKALTEQSPLEFIRIIRFNYAMELLQSQKYNITEIGEMCGFSSPSYFSTAFKKHFGKSPAEWQQDQ